MRLILCAIAVSTFFAAATAADDAPPAPDLRTRKSGDDWPRFLGPTGDSKSAEKGIITKWPVEGPKLVWEKEVAEGYCMPTISRGRLLLFDRTDGDPQDPDDDRNRLRCLRSETGEQLWEFKYPTDFTDLLGYSGGPRCSPVVDDGRVYILGGEGVLHCLSVKDGQVKWKMDTVKEFGVVKNFFGVGSTPVIEGDLLIMQVGGSPPGQAANVYAAGGRVKSNGSGIVAVNKHTGKVVYKITDELASYAGPVLATIGDRRWCFILARGGLVGFEPATGKVDFHYPWRASALESVNASNPVVVEDLVFISETYELGAALLKVKPGGFDEVWSDKDKRSRLKSMMTHWNTPIHIDGYVYGHSGRNSRGSDLRCIELKTGKVMWTVDNLNVPGVDQPLLLTRSSLLYVEGHFVCLTEHGVVVLLKVNPLKFEPVAVTVLARPVGDEFRPKLKYPCWAAPILSHGLLYLRGSDTLVCLELIPEKE